MRLLGALVVLGLCETAVLAKEAEPRELSHSNRENMPPFTAPGRASREGAKPARLADLAIHYENHEMHIAEKQDGTRPTKDKPRKPEGPVAPLVKAVQAKCAEDYRQVCEWQQHLLDPSFNARKQEGAAELKEKAAGGESGRRQERRRQAPPRPLPLGFGSREADECMRASMAQLGEHCRDAIFALDLSRPLELLDVVPLIGGLDKIEPYLTPASPGSSPPVSAGMNQRPKDLLVGKDEGDLRGPAFASSSAPFYYMEAEPNARPQGLDKLHPHSAMRGSGKSASTPPSPPQQGAVKKATFDGQQRVPSGGVWVQGNAGDEMTDEDGASVLAIGLALLTWLVLSLLVVSSFVRAEKRRETLLRLWRAVHEHPQLKHVVEQTAGVEVPSPPRGCGLRKLLRAFTIAVFVGVALHFSLYLSRPPPTPSSDPSDGMPSDGEEIEGQPHPILGVALFILGIITVGFLVKAVCSCCTSSRPSSLPPPTEDPAPLYTAPTNGYTGYAYTGPSNVSYNGSYNGYSAYAAVPGLDPAAVPTTPTGTHYTSLPEGSPPQAFVSVPVAAPPQVSAHSEPPPPYAAVV